MWTEPEISLLFLLKKNIYHQVTEGNQLKETPRNRAEWFIKYINNVRRENM